MKGMNVKLLTLCAAALLLTSCEKEEDLSFSKTDPLHHEECDVVTFEREAAGAYVNQVTSSGGMVIGVHGLAMDSDDEPVDGNRARIFDSEHWTGDDDDLATEDWGHVLIVQDIEDTPPVPNDNKYGSTLTLTFPEPVTLNSMKVIDIDDGTGDHPLEDLSYAYVYVEGSTDPILVHLEPHGDNKGFLVDFGGIENVVKLEVDFNGSAGAVGSGAIDDLRFCVPVVEMGCTRTQGYWKNHSYCKDKGNGKGKGNNKYDDTWDGFRDSRIAMIGGATYCEILWMAPKGDANIILAHQFIAAELNIAAGASYHDIDDFIGDVRLYFLGELNYEPNRAQLLEWAEMLDRYNNGLIGPGHCDD